ncbi:MAG: excisionase family DNA-binding protein [Thermoleophilia bacterium]
MSTREIRRERDWVTQTEAARLLGVSARTVQRMVADGRLTSRPAGSKSHIPRDELLAYLSERDDRNPPPADAECRVSGNQLADSPEKHDIGLQQEHDYDRRENATGDWFADDVLVVLPQEDDTERVHSDAGAGVVPERTRRRRRSAGSAIRLSRRRLAWIAVVAVTAAAALAIGLSPRDGEPDTPPAADRATPAAVSPAAPAQPTPPSATAEPPLASDSTSAQAKPAGLEPAPGTSPEPQPLSAGADDPAEAAPVTSVASPPGPEADDQTFPVGRRSRVVHVPPVPREPVRSGPRPTRAAPPSPPSPTPPAATDTPQVQGPGDNICRAQGLCP